MRLRTFGSAVTAISLACSLFACGGDGDGDQGKVSAQTRSVRSALSGPQVDNSIVVDEKGREWKVRHVTSFAPANGQRQAPTPSNPHGYRLDALSDQELAEMMRPIVLSVGPDGDAWEYTMLTADVDAIRTARAKEQAGWKMRVERDGTVTEGAIMPPPKSLEAFDLSEKGLLELQRPDSTMMKTHNWTRPISSQSFIGQLRYGDLRLPRSPGQFDYAACFILRTNRFSNSTGLT